MQTCSASNYIKLYVLSVISICQRSFCAVFRAARHGIFNRSFFQSPLSQRGAKMQLFYHSAKYKRRFFHFFTTHSVFFLLFDCFFAHDGACLPKQAFIGMTCVRQPNRQIFMTEKTTLYKIPYRAARHEKPRNLSV